MATPLGSSNGTINITGEHDWLRVNLTANTLYQVTSTLSSASFTVHDAGGIPVGSIDAAGGPLGFMSATSGTYYIDIDGGGIGSQVYTVFLASVTDDYRNNTGTAGTLAVGGSTAGNIDTAAEHDWLRVTLTANTLYQFTSTLTSGLLMMVDASGAMVATTDAYGAKLGFMPATSGTYYVDISDYADGTGAYTLSAATIIDDYRNNVGTSGTINIGGSANGILDTAGEHDWFRVTLSGNTLYQITNTLSTGLLTMYDASGTLVGATDAYGTSLGFMPVTSGSYYIDISDASSQYGGLPGPSAYTIAIATVADDHRNNIGTSGSVAVGGTATGTLNTAGEHDWLRASLTANTLYEITSTLITGTLTMYDASGNPVAATDAYGSSLGFMPATSGTYYIDIADFASQYGGLGGNGAYTVSLAAAADDYRNNVGTSGTFGPGGTASGVINVAGEHDWFQVALTANTLYQITSTLSAGMLAVYDATGAAVSTLDADGTSLGFMPASSGTYYIDVSDATSMYAPLAGSTPYTLSIAAVADDYYNNIGTTGSIGAAGGSGNTYNGTAGNDRLTGTTGNDTFNGLAGIDTVVFSGNRAPYTVAKSASGYTVFGGTDGSDILTGIERLEFADKKIALDLTPEGNTGQALEFIGILAFPVVTDPGVVGVIQSYFDNGYSMTSLCQTAINIGLIDQLAGSSSDVDLARLVYRNVVGGEADNATAQLIANTFLQTSGGTYSRVDFLATLAAHELNQTHIGLVGLQDTGVEYVTP